MAERCFLAFGMGNDGSETQHGNELLDEHDLGESGHTPLDEMGLITIPIAVKKPRSSALDKITSKKPRRRTPSRLVISPTWNVVTSARAADSRSRCAGGWWAPMIVSWIIWPIKRDNAASGPTDSCLRPPSALNVHCYGQADRHVPSSP